MNDLVNIFPVLNFLGLGGLAVFLYYTFKGLHERIQNLEKLAEEQKKTLEAVRERAREMRKLSYEYKKSFSDFQEMGKKLEDRRNELVKELESINRKQDEELAKLKKLQIEEIEIKQKSFARIPELEKKLESAIVELGKQLQIVSPSFKLVPKIKFETLYGSSLEPPWNSIVELTLAGLGKEESKDDKKISDEQLAMDECDEKADN